jgi:CheY-like chemotaxis protein
MSLSLPPVLVIDDEKNMRLSLKSILHGEGYDVQMVESAEEALAALERTGIPHGHHRRPPGQDERLRIPGPGLQTLAQRRPSS